MSPALVGGFFTTSITWEAPCVCVCVCVRTRMRTDVSDSEIPRTIVRQDPLFMEFSRQEYVSGLPFTSPGDLPNPGIKSGSHALQADSLLSEPPG